MPYNLCVVDQTISKPLGLINDLKIFVHGIPYTVTSIVINNNVLDSNYSMLLGRPWLRDAKISHNWGTNIVTIQGTSIVRTILVTKKLGVQTKRLEVLMCYDFHYGISNEEEDVMFTIKTNMFYVGTVIESTRIELVSKWICIPNFSITKPIPKHVELICILIVNLINLVIPPDTIKQHLPKTFFHLEVGEMIIDETLTWLETCTRSNHS